MITICPQILQNYNIAPSSESTNALFIGILTVLGCNISSKGSDPRYSIRFPVQKIYEDTYATHRILFRFKQIPVTNEPFYYYFFNPESIVHRKWSVARLDEVYATAEQIDYFIKNGFLSIAKTRFDYFRKISSSSIKKVEASAELTESEKRKHISGIRRTQRKVLIKCHR